MKSITRLIMMLSAALALGALVAGAQRTTIVNLASLPEWRVQKSQNVSLNDVRQWGVQPRVDREYGVTQVEMRTYAKGNKTIETVVEKTPDPSSAYGLLTFYHNENMKAEKGIKLAVIGPDQGLVARGAFFIRARRPPKMSEDDFRTALIAITGGSPSANAMGLLPPPLPSTEMVPGSHKYVLGPVAMQRALPTLPANLVGFQMGAELQSAVYRVNGKPVTMIFISYPTSAIARKEFSAFEGSLGVNRKSGTEAIYGQLKRSYVLLVQDAQTKEAATRMMNRLKIEQQLSWDQPPPGKPVAVQMFHLIMGNILLVLLLVGMAVLAGVLLFASRQIAAHWFPHSDWARGYEDSIIRLNLK
ncbi:MAG TPA: DUF6599 family protein [Terriglobia bacterium]|nr:DUF6599 family protein [Terriglobia bacterium]